MLISLDLERNQIENIEAIGEIGELNWLALGFNRIKVIEPLANLRRLRHLYLERNRLAGASLQPISGLLALRTLSLRGNQVDDINALTGMNQMSWLELDDNRIVDVTPLADMVLMEKLYIENNRVTKLEPLVKLVALKKFLARGNSIPSRQSTMLSKALPNCNEFKAGVFSTIPTRRRPSIPKDK